MPSLFRKLSDYKNAHAILTSPLWTALHDPSFAPWPLRPALAWLRNRNAESDLWNMCHFWSNFEIGDLDFFRGEEYTRLSDFLDREGGFYYERFGGGGGCGGAFVGGCYVVGAGGVALVW